MGETELYNLDSFDNRGEPTISLTFSCSSPDNTKELFEDQSLEESSDEGIEDGLDSSSGGNESSDSPCSSPALPVVYTIPVKRVPQSEKFTPQSILKQVGCLIQSDSAVVECSNLFQSVPNLTDLLFSVKKLFNHLCVDHFFNGDCVDSLCDKNHHLLPGCCNMDVTEQSEESVWNAALFAIRYSDQPDVQILKYLIDYFTEEKQKSKILAFAYCLSKLRSSQASVLAQYLVSRLISLSNEQDAVTTFLYLAAPQIDHDKMDLLMQSLGVFHRCLTYRKLLIYLNSLSHVMGYMHLLKIVEEIMRENCEDEGLIKAVDGFLNRLGKDDLSRMRLKVGPFFEKFRHRLTLCEEYTNSERFPIAHVSKSKKQVKFGMVHIAEFLPDPKMIHIPKLERSNCQSTIAEENMCVDTSLNQPPITTMALEEMRFEKRVSSVIDVFNEWCYSVLLSGWCSDTTCSRKHNIKQFTLTNVKVEDAALAAEFYIEHSTSPSLAILKAFLDNFVENHECSFIFNFAKCTSKLKPADAAMLSAWVLSSIKQLEGISSCLAVEVMLQSELNDNLDTSSSTTFYFDKTILKTFMNRAVKLRNSLPRFVSNAICERAMGLPEEDFANVETSVSVFFDKFVPQRDGRYPVMDNLPIWTTSIDFHQQFLIALLSGSTNCYSVVTIMLKFALGVDLGHVAADALYEFFMNNPCRQIASDMLQHCTFIHPESLRSAVKLVICNVAVSFCLRSYELGNLQEARAIFNMIRQHDYDLIDLEPFLYNKVPTSTLALISCILYAAEGLYAEVVDMFLKNVLKPLLKQAKSLSTQKQLKEIVEKMLSTFDTSNSITELLRLVNGISSELKHNGLCLAETLDMIYYSEVVLRYGFAHCCNENVRRSCLQLYFELVTSNGIARFQKVTLRSLLLTAIDQVTSTRRLQKQRVPHLFSSPIKHLLVQCIKSGAYPAFGHHCQKITLNSTMTFDEIKAYLFWRILLYLKRRKHAGVDYFENLIVNVVEENILNGTLNPIHNRIKNVDNTINGCIARLIAVIRSVLEFPMHSSQVLQKKTKCVYLLPWHTVEELARQVVQCLNLYDHTNVKNNYLCIACFDKDDIVLNSL